MELEKTQPAPPAPEAPPQVKEEPGEEAGPTRAEEEARLEETIRAIRPISPVPRLRGKGVWLLYSGETDLAIEMAFSIGATHILYKTGDRGMFFVDAARRVWKRVREAGLIPFAWTFIYCDDPLAEAEVALKSLEVGYEGVVFDIEDQAAGKRVAAATLGQRLLRAGVDPARLYYTSFPNIWQHLDIPYRQMNLFCRGGFMPQCYPTFRQSPSTVIDQWAYEEHARWSQEWGDMPPLYPILAAYKDEHATQRLTPQEFLEWAETLAAHEPPFFSIYRAGSTDQELWPILAALGEPPAPPPIPRPMPVEVEAAPPTEVAPVPPEPAPARAEAPPAKVKEAPTGPAPVYHIVNVNDTIWSICQRYGITRAQFWEWNGHLWDEQNLPRDALYMQEGWRVRVG